MTCRLNTRGDFETPLPLVVRAQPRAGSGRLDHELAWTLGDFVSAATYIAGVSAAVSFGVAGLSWRTARGAKTGDAYKFAGQLYDRLTVGEAAEARSTLEFYRRDRIRSERGP